MAALAFGLVLCVTASSSMAASCASLKAELSRLSRGAAPSASSQKWQTAQRQQTKAIAAAERDASFFRCGTSGAQPSCGALTAKIKRMKSNLAAIERQLAKSGGGAGSTARIRKVRQAISAQNCDGGRDAQAEARRDAGEPKSFFARLFAPKDRAQAVSARSDDVDLLKSRAAASSSRVRLPRGGTFRTLCVRTCDGYFFPVSFSTGKDQFSNDEARCGEICPAATTELYVYRNPGGDPEEMMSLAGDRYTDQPFAHRYKSEIVDGCSCRGTQESRRPSAWAALDTSGSSADRVFLADISNGLPRSTIAPSRGDTYASAGGPAASPLSAEPMARDHLPAYADPATLLDLELGFDVTVKTSAGTTSLIASAKPTGVAEKALPLLASRPPVTTPASETTVVAPDQPSDPARPVRVVGPQYFVAQ